MKKTYRAVPADEVFAGFTPERRARVKKRSDELIAEELALRDLRNARQLTQAEVARRLGGRQVYVSRLESRADMKLSTLRDYLGAIGGDLHLVVSFPQGNAVRLKEIGDSHAVPKRPRRPAATRMKKRPKTAG
jgi:hypothetical protein